MEIRWPPSRRVARELDARIVDFHLLVEKLLGPGHPRAGDDPGTLFGDQQVERFKKLAEAVVDGAGGGTDRAIEDFEPHCIQAGGGKDEGTTNIQAS